MKWVLSLEKNVHRFPPAAYWMKSKFLMLKHHHDWNIIFLFSSSPARPCVLSRVRLFCDPMDCSPLVSSLWGFPGKNTRVGCHFILQGILQIQGWNLHLLHWQVDSLPLCYLGSFYQASADVIFRMGKLAPWEENSYVQGCITHKWWW